MTYANSNHEPFNMCRFFTRPESDLCPALSVTDAADVVETLNDVTLCPKYYTISILLMLLMMLYPSSVDIWDWYLNSI